MKYIILLSTLMVVQNVFSQDCLGPLNEFKNKFEQKKNDCAKSDLGFDYVAIHSPNFANAIPACLSLAEACASVCEKADAKSTTCHADKANNASSDSKKSGLAESADTIINSMNQASHCVEAALEDCSAGLRSAQLKCSGADEGIFRANDGCDVDFTNIIIGIRRLNCDSTNQSEIKVFNEHKEELLTEFSDYANQALKWGKKVAAKVDLSELQCHKLHVALVIRKNEAVRSFMKTSDEAFKMKRNISSGK